MGVCLYASLEILMNTEFLLGSKIKYFVILYISSCEKFFERKAKLHTRRVVRVVDDASFEMLCSQKEPRVQSPTGAPNDKPRNLG